MKKFFTNDWKSRLFSSLGAGAMVGIISYFLCNGAFLVVILMGVAYALSFYLTLGINFSKNRSNLSP